SVVDGVDTRSRPHRGTTVRPTLPVLALTAVIALAACGSGDDDTSPAPAASPTTAAVTAATTAPAAATTAPTASASPVVVPSTAAAPTPAAEPTAAPASAAPAPAATPSSVDLDTLSHQFDAVGQDVTTADGSLTQASSGIGSSEPIPG